MKKNYVIITEELKKEPGIYGAKLDKKLESNIKLVDNFEELSNKNKIGILLDNVLQVAKVSAKKIFVKKEYTLEKIADIDRENTGKSKDLKDKLVEVGIAIPSKYMKNQYECFDENIFDGCFKKKEDFSKILPINDDYSLFVVEYSEAREIFLNGDSLNHGLHVIDLETKRVYPVINYQEKRWRDIELAIRMTFSNLGSKRIFIREVNNIELELGNGGEVKIKEEKKHWYEKQKIKELTGTVSVTGKNYSKIAYEEIWEEQVYNPQEAMKYVELLRDVPIFFFLANDLINNQRKGKIKRIEEIDFSLGIDFEILNIFNFNTNISRQKTLEIEIEL